METITAFDKSFPSDKELCENPHCKQDELWIHAANENVDKVGMDALRDIHGAVCEEGFSSCYSKNINW